MHQETQSPNQQHYTHDHVMRINKFCEGLGIGRSTYYKLLAEGKIEPALKISKRARGHMESYFNRLTKAMREQA